MFFQTVLQSLLKKKKKQARAEPPLQNEKQSPLVQKILSEMRKHSAAKHSQSPIKNNEIDKESKS